MHVLDLFNDKDRNFLNGGAMAEGGMPDVNLEYEDYLKLPPMAFQSRYKMSKEAWAEKYKNLLPKPAPKDPTAGMPDAPFEAVDQLDELTPTKLANYITKANTDARNRLKQDPNNQFKKAEKRMAGMSKIRATMEPATAKAPGVEEGSNPEKVEVRFSAKEYAAMTPAQKAAKQQEWQQLKQQAKMRMQNFTLIDTDKEQGVAEGEDRVDSLVTRGLEKMQGPRWLDAVAAIKAQVGERDYRDRKQFYDFFVQQLVDMYGKKDVAEGKPNLKCVCKTMGPEQCPVHAPMDEGWLKNTVAGAAIAGAALGAQARVTPGQDDPNINRLTGKPNVTQVAPVDQKPAVQAPAGFSKEYLQSVVDGKHPRPLVSIEKAQQLLKQMQEGVAEGVRELGYDAQSLIMKLRRDVEEKRLQPTPQAVLAAARELAGDMDFAPQLLVKQVLGQSVAEADMNRRGFLKAAGAAAVAGVGVSSQAQPDQQQDLGNGFVTAKATIDGVTYRAIQDTISKSGYMLNHRGDGTPIVNRPGEFLVVRNGKIEARTELAPNVIRALQKAGILSMDDSQVPTQTSPAVTHSSRGGTNQPAVTYSSRGGTNQPAVTYSSSNRKPRNEDTASRMKMDDYIKAAEELQDRLSQAIKQGDRDLIKKLSKERDELDARVRQHGMVPEASKLNKPGKETVGEATVQSLVASYKNLLKRVLGIAFSKKQNASDPMAFQRMMSKITSPVDTSKYQAIWQEYKNDKQYYVTTPHPVKDIKNKEIMYLWANSLAQFVSNKYPDAPIEALTRLVEALAEFGAKEAINQKQKGLGEATQQKPRVRKYTKMRPDGSKAVRYEVLDHMGRRITGQGPEGFDDPKLAKDFYYKNYDRLASLDEIVDRSVSDTPTKPVMKEAGGRYWCSTEKRWKDS